MKKILAVVALVLTAIPISKISSNYTPHTAFQAVQITEIDYDGFVSFDDSETSSTKEAIEIVNTTDSEVSLANWQLRIMSGNTHKSIIIPEITLASREVFIFVRGLDIPDGVKGINYTGALSNSEGAFIELRDGNGVTVDSFNQYGKWSVETQDVSESLQYIDEQWVTCASSVGTLNSCSVYDDIVESPVDDLEEEIEGESELDENLVVEELLVVGDLIINEILPNPVGSDSDGEFVEIYNMTDREIDLGKVILDDILDGGSSPQQLEGVIGPKEYLVISGADLSLSLNNSGDSVFLIRSSDSEVIDGMSYEDSEVIEGKSIGRIENEFEVLDTPTSGRENEKNTEVIGNDPKGGNYETEETAPQASVYIPPKGNILLSEVIPNPEGSDTEGEFIEIHNISQKDVDLTGWVIRIGDKDFEIKSSSVGGGEYFALYRKMTKLTLSNSRTFTIELISPDGEVYDGVTIIDQEDHHSFSKVGNAWKWTMEVTPNEENQISSSLESSDDQKIPVVPIAELYNHPHNIPLKTSGVVVRGSSLNEKYLYISNAGDIVKVYSTKKNLDEFIVGDEIEVSGTWFQNENNTYLRIKDVTEDIVKIGKGVAPESNAVLVESLENIELFSEVRVSGIVDGQSGRSWRLLTEEGEVKVELAKDLGLTKPEFRKGDSMTVRGFIDIERGVRRVVVYDVGMISVSKQVEESTTPVAQAAEINPSDDEDGNRPGNLAELLESVLEKNVPVYFEMFQRWVRVLLGNRLFLGALSINVVWFGGMGIKDMLEKRK